MTVTDTDVMALLQSHGKSIENIDKCLERDSREIVKIGLRAEKSVITIIDLRERMDATDRGIALIHLAMAMLLGCSAGALVISLLGAVV